MIASLLLLQVAAADPPSNIAVPAKMKVGSWMVDDDYPVEAFRLRQEGKVVVAFDISARGRIEHCAVTQSSGSPALDAATCKIALKGPSYEPARDAKGHPVRSTGKRTMNWALPR